jgi:hypothetical protein
MPIAINGTGTISGVSAGGLTSASNGRILQVVNATYSTLVTTSSSTYSDTGLTASITPSSATSKVLVIVNQNGTGKDSANTWQAVKLQRNGSDISQIIVQAAQTNTTVTLYGQTVSTAYLDSPATTSSVTYKTQFNNVQGIGSTHCQLGSAMSTITLMEIAA